jgi:hypothetical protein
LDQALVVKRATSPLPEGQRVPIVAKRRSAPDPFGIWYPELRLQQLIRLFYNEINIELMANIYPNKPILEKTLFFDLLQYYTFSESDLELLRVHFRCSTDYLGWAPKELS